MEQLSHIGDIDGQDLQLVLQSSAQQLSGGNETAYNEISSILTAANPGTLNGDEHRGDRENLARRIDDVRRRIGIISPATTPPANETAPANPAASSSIYYEAAVMLTRRTGRRIIAPLWMAEMTSVGEIWMNDGDLLEIVHYTRTEVGARLVLGTHGIRQGNVALTGFVSGSPASLPNMTSVANIDARAPHSPACDVIVLQHVNEHSHLEEYLFPRTTSSAYGDNAALNYWADNTMLSDGDVVNVGSLDLFPPIIEGRARAVSVNQHAVRQLEMTKCERHQERMTEHHQSFANNLRRIPVLGTVVGAVGQTGLNGPNIGRTVDRTRETASAVPGAIGLPRLVN